MKKHLSLLIVALIFIAFTISGYSTKQDINDMAYVIAIRCRRSERQVT